MILKKTAAFTLVELAIVIVIIGLLVGGVLQGQELIQQAKMRKIQTDFESYKSAVFTFYGKFTAYPGDFNRATSFISTDTYNGNGNLQISYDNEVFYVWHHLSLTKLIKGTFTGQTAGAPGTYLAKKGVNVPQSSSFDGSYWIVTWSVLGGGKAFIRLAHDTAPDFPYGATLTPMTTYLLDLKLDDGAPSRGLFHGSDGASHAGLCRTASGEYNLTYNEPSCMAFYQIWN